MKIFVILEAQLLLCNAEGSPQLIIRLKSFRVGALLSELINLDHNIGPEYLMDCLPYFTILYLGRIKSEFLSLYGFKSFVLEIFQSNLALFEA